MKKLLTDTVVDRTDLPNYSEQNVHGDSMGTYVSEIYHTLKRGSELTPIKREVFYKKDQVRRAILDKNSVEACRYFHGLGGLLSELIELDEARSEHLTMSTDTTKAALAMEIGDAMWFLGLIAKSSGLTLGECEAAMAAKLKARYPDKFTEHMALSRDEEKETEAVLNTLGD